MQLKNELIYKENNKWNRDKIILDEDDKYFL